MDLILGTSAGQGEPGGMHNKGCAAVSEVGQSR